MKLTEAQKRCLRSVGNGAVKRDFDVWSGYRWHKDSFSTAWRATPFDAPPPLTHLTQMGLIELGSRVRPFSGRHIETYLLTPTGRLALDRDRQDGRGR